MKTLRILSLPLLLLLFACNQQSAKPEVVTDTPANSMEANESDIKIDLAQLAGDKDLVCGMSLKGGISDTVTYNGKLYGFCSPDCKDEFIKSPSQYFK